MSERIFVDTGGWVALFVSNDQYHGAARHWFNNNSTDLLTTDYVVDETLTLLRKRVGSINSIRIGKEILDPGYCHVERISEKDFDSALQLFERFDDKAWSFTDCVSRVVMQRLQIATALAFDEHFRQFGTVNVVP